MFVLGSRKPVVIRGKSIQILAGGDHHDVELKSDYLHQDGEESELVLSVKTFGCETAEEFFDLFQLEYESPPEPTSPDQEEEQVWQIVRDDLDAQHYWNGEYWTEEPLQALRFHFYDGKTGKYWATRLLERLREQHPKFARQAAKVELKPHLS